MDTNYPIAVSKEQRLMIFKNFIQKPTQWIAFDVGTANIRAADVFGHILIDQCILTCMCHSGDSLKGVACGRAMQQGVVRDADLLVLILTGIIKKLQKRFWEKLSVFACAPSDASAREIDLLTECLRKAGAADCSIFNEVTAAAIGAGLDIASSYPVMLVDIGHGVTDIVVLKEGRIVAKEAKRIGCHSIYQTLDRYFREKNNLLLCELEIERLVKEIGILGMSPRKLGSLFADSWHTGRDSSVIESISEEILKIMLLEVQKILDFIRSFFIGLSPEMGAAVIDSGIWLSGGGACLKGIDRALETQLNIRVQRSPHPLHSVIRGASMVMCEMCCLKSVIS